MTAVLLQQALCKRLEYIVSNIAMETPKDSESIPKVHAGYLPQRIGGDDTSDFPYIIVRVLDGEDSTESNVKLKLLFGTHSRSDNGFTDTLNLMERVRQGLLKARILDNKYRLELPYRWKLFEDQPYPEWIGEAVTQWTVPAIIEETMN